MHPLDDDPHETTDPAPDLASLRPLRLFQTVTAVTGALSAAGVGGVLALQSTPGYARAVLEARSWGASEVTDADGHVHLDRQPYSTKGEVGANADAVHLLV